MGTKVSHQDDHSGGLTDFRARLATLIETSRRLLHSVRLCAARVEIVNNLADLRDAVHAGHVPADQAAGLLRKMQAVIPLEESRAAELSSAWVEIAAEARALMAATRDPAPVPLTSDRYRVAREIEEYVGQLVAPFRPTEAALRRLSDEVRNLLNALPLYPPELHDLREEIERLPAFCPSTAPRLSIQQAERDLPILHDRLRTMQGLASVTPARTDGRQAHKGRPRPFQQNEEVRRLKILVREIYQDLVQHGVRRDLHRMICQRLANHPRPPSARWPKYPWPEALRRFPKAVRTWLSKAIHERE